jgi:protein involved in polysaccharide export with SLBB domain
MKRTLLMLLPVVATLAPAVGVSAQSPGGQAPAAMAHNSGTAPAATAGENEYRLSAGDKIHVIVFGEDTLTGDYVITSAGNLSFPLVGSVKADDKTVEQLQIALATVLSNGFLNNPRVSIQVISFRPFYILGEVNRPGEYPVQTGLTIEQAVATAGGYTYRANTHRIFLKRATEAEDKLVDLKKSDPVIVHAGDTIRIRERHF